MKKLIKKTVVSLISLSLLLGQSGMVQADNLIGATAQGWKQSGNTTKVDESYDKQSIELKKGDILELTLPENADGGYSWQFNSSLDNNILKVIYETYILPNSSPNIVGGVRKKRWLIQAVGNGDTSINLKESRSWDANSTMNTFNLKTTVR